MKSRAEAKKRNHTEDDEMVFGRLTILTVSLVALTSLRSKELFEQKQGPYLTENDLGRVEPPKTDFPKRNFKAGESLLKPL